MDYEKKYNEALKRAKAAIDIAADKDLVKGVATTIFPELRESEDERVIRTLYYLVRDHDWVNGATKGEALAWLEKQKERKPAGWSEEDNKMLAGTLNSLKRYQLSMPNYQVELQMRWLKSLRPVKQEWSKKDEDKLYQVMGTLLADKAVALRDAPHCKALHEAYDEMLAWLKSLRPSWKPSEEDERILKGIIGKIDHDQTYGVSKDEMLNFLKKLWP